MTMPMIAPTSLSLPLPPDDPLLMISADGSDEGRRDRDSLDGALVGLCDSNSDKLSVGCEDGAVDHDVLVSYAVG